MGFPTVGQMTLRMNSRMLMPSEQDREVVERQQKVFTQGWIPCSLDTLRLRIFKRQNQDKFLEDRRQENDGLDASEVRTYER